MADFNGKYLADKYKHQSHIARQLSEKVYAGATGSPLVSSCKNNVKTPRCSRRRISGSALKNKNGLISHSSDKQRPSEYLANVSKNSKTQAQALDSTNSNTANNLLPSTPISANKPLAVRSSMKKKVRNDSFSHHKPAEVFRKDLISAMKIPDSTPMPSDEYWIMQDPWKMDWEKGVQVPVNPGALPKLSCKKIREVTKGAYKMSRKMIKSTPDIGDRETVDMNVVADTICRYDLDEVDVAWLEVSNQDRKRQGFEHLDEDRMEIIMEELETQCHENLQLAIRTKEGLGIEYDEDIVCDVCRSPDCEEGNEMVFCDGCNLCVHQACYGILKVPTGNWLCKPCALGIRGSAECILCGKKGGAMKSTRTGQKWAHVSCALWIPEISIADPERMEPITKVSHIPSSRWALICSVCKARVGACIQCSVKNCVTAYHVTCAIENRFDMSTDYQPHSPQPGSLAYGSDGGHSSDRERPVVFKSFCRKHSKNCRKISEEEIEKSEEQKRGERQKRIEELEQDFYSLVKCEGVVNALKIPQETALVVMEYWKLKRRANFNRPLITPKQDESNALEEAAETGLQRRLRMFTHLRQDLERVRNLCYMIGRREKLKRTMVKNMENVYLAQMKVVEQQMSHDKNFYPATLLPTLPTFGKREVCEAAREETAILKQSKEWGGVEENNPPTPSTDYSNESSPRPPSTSTEEIKKESQDDEQEILTSVDKVNAIPPEQRSNIGFGLRSKQHQTLLKKETSNKNLRKSVSKPTSPKPTPKAESPKVEEKSEVNKHNENNKSNSEKTTEKKDNHTVTESKACNLNKPRTRNKVKSNEIINEQGKQTVEPENNKIISSSPAPQAMLRRSLRSSASTKSDTSSDVSKAEIQEGTSTTGTTLEPSTTSKSTEKEESNKPDNIKPLNANKRKLSCPSPPPDGIGHKKARNSSSTASPAQNEGYQLSLRSSANSPASLENVRVTRSKVSVTNSKPSTPKQSTDSNGEKKKSKNEVGALADLCSNSGDSESSGWDDNLSLLSKQELNRNQNQQHHTAERDIQSHANIDANYTPMALPLENEEDVKSPGLASLRWVPLDGEDDSGDDFQQNIHIPDFRQKDNSAGTNFTPTRQSERRRSSNSIIPAAKTLRLDSSEEEDELLLPWKSKLKRRKQLESISNLEDIKKNMTSPKSQKVLNPVLKVNEIPSPKAKNVMAVGSMLPEQKYAHESFPQQNNAPSVDGNASMFPQNFLQSHHQHPFYTSPPPPYSYHQHQIPYPSHGIGFQHNEPRHFHYFNHPPLEPENKPSPPPLPDSTLSPESALPVSFSVAVQASQPQPAMLPPGDPTVMDILQYTSESDNEWEVITNPVSVTEDDRYSESPAESYTRFKKKKKRRKKKKKHKRKRVYRSSSSDEKSTSDEEENVSETSQKFKSELNESPGKLLLKIDKKSFADNVVEDTDYSSSEEFQTENVSLDEKQLETHKLLTQQTAPRLKFKFTLSKTTDSQESQETTDLENRYVLSTVKELPKIKKPRIKKVKQVVNNDEDIAIGRRSLRERVEPDKKTVDEPASEPATSQPKIRTKKPPKVKLEKSEQDKELFRKIVQSKLRTVHMREAMSNKKKIRSNKRVTRSDMIQSNIGVVKSEVMQQNSSSSSPENEKFILERTKVAQAMSSAMPVRHWKKRKVYEHQRNKFITAPIKSIAEALSKSDNSTTEPKHETISHEDSITETSTSESVASIPIETPSISENKDSDILHNQPSTANNAIEASS